MKRILFSLLALWVLCVPVFAAPEIDIDYVGQIDPYTGEPVSSVGASEENRVFLEDGIVYDREEDVYVYTVSGTSYEVTSNVMDGMLTTKPVTIYVPEGITAELFRNGGQDNQSLDSIREPGSYVLKVTSYSGFSAALMHFNIVSDCTGAVELYRMPKDFLVTELLLNDEPIEFNTAMVNFTEEGRYTVTYMCYPTKVFYTLELTTDFTPPELSVNGVGEDGVARGPVGIYMSPDTVTREISFNGTPVRYSDEVTKMGYYEVAAEDEAGNRATAAFTIMLYLNTTSIAFIALVSILLIILVVYLLRYRNRMRVR